MAAFKFSTLYKVEDHTAIGVRHLDSLAGSSDISRALPPIGRWNQILGALDINLSAELRLTPGGLRGGGAVESYRREHPSP